MRKYSTPRPWLVYTLAVVFSLQLASCSASNNLLLGEVEARVGDHLVKVTDCYRFKVSPPETVNASTYRFTPCRDADILIESDTLTVNGQSYGHINSTDAILVDHGVVKVNP